MPKSWKYSSATTLEHNDIFAVHKYRYIHAYKNRPGNKNLAGGGGTETF